MEINKEGDAPAKKDSDNVASILSDVSPLVKKRFSEGFILRDLSRGHSVSNG